MKETLKKRYAAFCPYSEKKLSEMAGQDNRRIRYCAVAATFALLLWNFHFGVTCALYLMGCILLANYVICLEIPSGRLRTLEYRFYKEYLMYLARVKHSYAERGHVPNAVRDAAEEATAEEIRRHALVLYQILSSTDRKEQVRNYIGFTEYNQYLKLFLVQAYEASEKGDTVLPDGKSLFAENLEYLRLLVMEELYRRRKRNHEFAGYTFVSVLPVFFLPLFRSWGLEFTEGLLFFYHGPGKLVELLTLLLTLGVYQYINQAKQVSFLYEEPERRRKEISVLRQLAERLDHQTSPFSMRIRGKMLQVGMRGSFGQLLLKAVAASLAAAVAVPFFLLQSGMEEVWMLCAGSVLCGMAAGAVPFCSLHYRYLLFQQNTEQEIRQFQSVVLMERRLKDITIPELLEDMEIFSRMFRNILRECINSYAAGPEQALQRMKEKGGAVHNGFCELSEAFLAVDGIGVQKAFEEVESNRMMLEKMSQLENEIRMENRKDGMELFSKVPMGMAVLGYFVLPFLVESLRGVSEVFRILEELRV